MEIQVCGYPVQKISIPPGLASQAKLEFGALWQLHPAKPNKYRLSSGREVVMPRYQQAYDRVYSFGSDGGVLPLPDIMKKYAVWLADNICPGYDGAMVTWYDSHLGHYIGCHRDDVSQLTFGSPICSLSFGATRQMRFKRKGLPDEFIEVAHGDVVIIPAETNKYVMHGVDKGQVGLRISFTARDFK